MYNNGSKRANSESYRLLFGRFGRFIQFRLSSLCGAVVVAAVVFALMRLGLVARKEALERVWPPLTGRYALTASGDNSVRAARSQFGSLVCEAATGEKLFALELLGHSFDGHLYAIDPYVVPEGAPRWQRWNQRASRWELADEGLRVSKRCSGTREPRHHRAGILQPSLFLVP